MIDVLEILGNGKYNAHSFISLTYGVDLCFYDSFVRRLLRRSGVDNQVLLCDAMQYQRALIELTGAPRCGFQYSVTPASVPGAFHPKAYMLLGERVGVLVIGSGNLTIGGLLRNSELFGIFEFDGGRVPPHPAFREVIDLAQSIARLGSTALRSQLDRAVRNSPWLKETTGSDGRFILVSGPDRPPLIEQIQAHLGKRQVEHVTVCSPYFDRELKVLSVLQGLAGNPHVTCIVQPDLVRLDGTAVKRLAKGVSWKPFLDQSSRRGAVVRDSFAHHKLMIFNCGPEELVVYGSANASHAAVLSDGSNLEISVVLPWLPSGTTVSRLDLHKSLSQNDITAQLFSREWHIADGEATVLDAPEIQLTAALVEAGRVILSTTERRTSDKEQALHLEFARRLGDANTHRVPLSIGPAGLECPWPSDVVYRCVRIVDIAGRGISNPVALTWSEVSKLGRVRTLSARFEQALGTMKDGEILGTIVFDLLNQVGDFEVLAGPSHGGGRRTRSKTEDKSLPARSTDAFYTDRPSSDTEAGHFANDRMDLDMVAALIQPLASPGGSTGPIQDTDERFDLGAFSEEEERRGIDDKGGAADGDERQPAAHLSSSAIWAASTRVERRLSRATVAAETALGAKEHGTLRELSLQSIARQVWMIHVAAFLAGRKALTADGDEFVCLEEHSFAEYVLRIGRVLAGGREGGLIALLPENSWAGYDGENMSRGLGLVVTCVTWAAWWVRKYWEDPQHNDEIPDGVWDSAYDLIAARLVAVAGAHAKAPDLFDLERRFPASRDPGPAVLQSEYRRLLSAAKAMLSIEETHPPAPYQRSRIVPGQWVFNPKAGVSIAVGPSGNNMRLFDLSRENAVDTLYGSTYVHPVFDQALARLKWRNYEDD